MVGNKVRNRQNFDHGGSPGFLDLVNRIANSDRGAEDELVQLFSSELMQFIGSKLNEQHHHFDVYQETMLRLLIKLRAGEVAKPQALKYYMFSIANHLIYRVITQRNLSLQTLSHTDIDSICTSQSSAFEQLEAGEQQRILDVAISQLNTLRDRKLLQAYILECQDKNEVCLLLGLTSALFDRIFHRAKTRLIEQIKALTKGD